ncbi:MAG TPA: hypothetical protein VGY13_10610 [Solirubrobacteraceae bacterium]|jgi:hypothetical protein|nr:hypothetical protein [Solirubrobacteraceae bacterium]
MTTIPADAVVQLREALHSELGNVAEELDAIVVTSERARDDWSPPVARFDRARALLDELGWKERDVAVDLDRHRQVIVEALSEALEGDRYLMSEQGRHAGRQRRNARARAATIEAFMDNSGLERA